MEVDYSDFSELNFLSSCTDSYSSCLRNLSELYQYKATSSASKEHILIYKYVDKLKKLEATD